MKEGSKEVRKFLLLLLSAYKSRKDGRTDGRKDGRKEERKE